MKNYSLFLPTSIEKRKIENTAWVLSRCARLLHSSAAHEGEYHRPREADAVVEGKAEPKGAGVDNHVAGNPHHPDRRVVRPEVLLVLCHRSADKVVPR